MQQFFYNFSMAYYFISVYLHSYPVCDLPLPLPSTYLHLPQKSNRLCLFCRLNLLNFSSLGKLVSRRKCKHKNEILCFYCNLFIPLIYILASCSMEVKPDEESGSAAKKPNLDLLGEPRTSGESSTRETGKFKGKDKRKVSFSVN